MKKGTLVTLFTSGIIIISIVFVMFALWSSIDQKKDAYLHASLELGKMYTLNKVISSTDCLSTGEVGVLDKTLLDNAAASGNELDCAKLPDFSHKVKVEDLTTPTEWVFGYTGFGDWEDTMTTYVSIVDGDTIIPGKLSLKIMSSDSAILGGDELICFVGAAERAWVFDNYEAVCMFESSTSKKIKFDGDKICLEDSGGNIIKCKDLVYSTTEIKSCDVVQNTASCTLNYIKTPGPPPHLTIDKCECKVDPIDKWNRYGSSHSHFG